MSGRPAVRPATTSIMKSASKARRSIRCPSFVRTRWRSPRSPARMSRWAVPNNSVTGSERKGRQAEYRRGALFIWAQGPYLAVMATQLSDITLSPAAAARVRWIADRKGDADARQGGTAQDQVEHSASPVQVRQIGRAHV